MASEQASKGKAFLCEGSSCPLQTKKGLALYLVGLVIGVFAPFPFQIVGLVILVSLFMGAKCKI